MKILGPIIYDNKEPENKNALWYYKESLKYFKNGSWCSMIETEPAVLQYTTDQDKNIKSVKQALDKLLYVNTKINTFSVPKSGTYEVGQSVDGFTITWTTNKDVLQNQVLNGQNIDPTLNSFKVEGPITSNVPKSFQYTLSVSDGTSSNSASASISFTYKIYAGLWDNSKSAAEDGTKIKSTTYHNFMSTRTFTVDVDPGCNMWMFVPNAANATKLVKDNIDCTSDFNKTNYTHKNVQGIEVEGKLYVSKNTSLGKVTITVQ